MWCRACCAVHVRPGTSDGGSQSHLPAGRRTSRQAGGWSSLKSNSRQQPPGADPGVDAGAGGYTWNGKAPLKIHHSIAFKHQSIIGRPPLGQILYPPLVATDKPVIAMGDPILMLGMPKHRVPGVSITS